MKQDRLFRKGDRFLFYVENDNEIILKTAFPSRKSTKKYGLKGE